MASLGLVSPGAATDGLSHIFLKKKLTTFLVITVCQFCGVTPIYFFPKNWRPFLLITFTFIDFTRVSTHGGCQPAPFFYLSHLVCSLSFCKFTHNFFFVRLSPPGGCLPGRSAPPPVTPLYRLLVRLQREWSPVRHTDNIFYLSDRHGFGPSMVGIFSNQIKCSKRVAKTCILYHA